MLEAFHHVPLFQDLGIRELSLLEPMFERYTCPAHFDIFEQGEPAAYLYLILSGTVSIVYKPHDGPPISIKRLRKGDIFGWSAVIGSPAYTSGVKSLETVHALRIRAGDLKQLRRQHPDLSAIILDRFARAVSSRWTNADQQIKSMLERGVHPSGFESS